MSSGCHHDRAPASLEKALCAFSYSERRRATIYMNEDDRDQFLADYKATGKRLDVGKSCVVFRKLEDLPLELIGRVIASMSPETFVTKVEALRTSKR